MNLNSVFVAFMIAVDIPASLSVDCNPFDCISSINNLFHQNYDIQNDICIKFKKVKGCFDSCLPLFIKDVTDVQHGLERLTQKVCKDDAEKNLSKLQYWHLNTTTRQLKFVHGDIWYKKCLDRRKFQLLSCVYGALNLVPEDDSLRSKNIFHCRKIMEAENCPSDALSVCKDDAVREYVEHLLMKYFQPHQEDLCYAVTINEVWSVKIKPVTTELDNYEQVFKCIDANYKRFYSCVPLKWTSNFIMDRYRSEEFCSAVDNFLDCVSGLINKACGESVLNFSRPLTQKVKQAFQVQCPVPVTTEVIASKMVLTPYTDEEVRMLAERENNSVSGYQDDEEQQFIFVHFGSVVLSEAVYVKSLSVIIYVMFLFVIMSIF